MFKKILVPTDGSSLSDHPIHAAIEIAAIHQGRVVAFSVAEPHHFSPIEGGTIAREAQEYDEMTREEARGHVNKVAALAHESGVTCEAYVVHSFKPAEAILYAADKFQCDAIFMATHARRGLDKFLVGSQTQTVIEHSVVPVVVFPPG